MKLKILSWNILSNEWIQSEYYKNIDINLLFSPNRYLKIIDYINIQNPDIILLQEVDTHLFNIINHKFKYKYNIFQSNPIIWDKLFLHKSTYNIILTNKSHLYLNKSFSIHKSNYSLILYNNKITIINVHLHDSSLFKRREEINNIKTYFNNSFIIIGGDFNDDKYIYSQLINTYNFIKYNHMPTYYIDNNNISIDNILIKNKSHNYDISPQLFVPTIHKNENNMFKNYHSDHLPVILSITISI